MAIYLMLVAYILIGQSLLSGKIISKKFYCVSVCIIMVLITGLRDTSVGMWDTQFVYLPSFKIIQEHTISQILQMKDTQYRFLGFVFYSKLIGLISTNENFYILMMAWPFYACATYLIKKWSEKPGYSFVILLGFGYFTYSFSMIRGMLALAFSVLALDAALEDKWRKFLIYVTLSVSCHITALVFLMVYPIKKVKWTIAKIISIFWVLIALNNVLPLLWSNFVTTYIRNILPTYNYYGSSGGMLASGMLILYIMTGIVALIKIWISKGGIFKIKLHMPNFKIKKMGKKAAVENELGNMLMGMTVVGSILIFMTSVLSEMMRIAMFLGLSSTLLIGNSFGYIKNSGNKQIIRAVELLQVVLLLIYFFMSALPNMNAVPYKFFFNE